MLKKPFMISRHELYLFVMKIIDVLIHELLFVISARRNVDKMVDRNVTSCFLKYHDFMTPTRPPLHSSTIFQNVLPLWQHLLHWRRMFFTIHIVSVAAHLLQVKRPSQCIVSDLQPVLFLSVMNYTAHQLLILHHSPLMWNTMQHL
jgi:hypothetical protein